MGKGIRNFFRDPIGSLTDLTSGAWDLIEDISGIAWSEILNPVIEPVMSVFGITDETMVITDVVSQKLFDGSEIVSKALVKGVLELQRTDKDYIHILSKIAQQGHSQFNRFYTEGLHKYVDYLPESNVVNASIDPSVIKSLLESEENTTIEIQSAYFRSIHDEEWIHWFLQENYNYNIATNLLIYDDIIFQLNSFNYDLDTETYICMISTVGTILTRVYEITTTTIVNISPTEDSKTVLIEHRTLKLDDENNPISDITVEVSTTTTSIPKDSESSSVITDLIDETVENVPYYNINIEDITPQWENSSYVVTYNLSDTVTKIWLYDPLTEVYPSIKDPVSGITSLDMLPVVTLRNSKVNVSEVSNPERYQQSKNILNLIGLDIDTLISNISDNPSISNVEDAFIYFGLSFTETKEVASKVLYKTFKFIYDNDLIDITTADVNNSKVITFKETPMNMALAWMPTRISNVAYTIPDNKQYHHDIVNSNIITETHRIHTITGTRRVKDSGYEFNYEYLISIKNRVTTYDETSGEILNITYSYFGTGAAAPTGEEPLPVGTDISVELLSTVTTESFTLNMYERIDSITATKLSLVNLSNLTIINRGSKIGVHSQKIDDPDLAIPLSIFIVNQLSLIEKAELFEMTLRFNFYAIDVVHIDWYRSASFMNMVRFVTLAVSLVMLAVSFGGTTPITTILLDFATQIAITVGLSLALDYLFKQTDSMFLRIVGTIALAIASSAISPTSSSLVDDAFAIAMTTVNSIDMIYQEKLEILEESKSAFQDKANSREEELQEFYDSLNGDLTTEDILYLTQSNDVSINMSYVKNYYDMALGKVSTNYDLLYKGFYDSKNKKFYDNIYDI